MKKKANIKETSRRKIKIAALLAGVSLLLMTGCGNKAQDAAGTETRAETTAATAEQATTEQATTQTAQTDPETLDYAYRLHISINPEFKMYLNGAAKVMAVDCLNQDAENLFSETDLTGMGLEEAMPVIVQQAVAKDYLTDGKMITIDIEISPNPEQADSAEQVITGAVTAKLKEQGVDAALQLQEAGTPIFMEGTDTNTSSAAVGNDGEMSETGENNAVVESGNTESRGTTETVQKTKCTACGGTGICQECQGGTAPCKRCGGSLWEACGTCGGSGRQNCPGCGGSGTDATDGANCRHCGGSGSITCGQCNGSGGKSCSICHGKGVISDDCILCHGDKKCTVCGGSGEL